MTRMTRMRTTSLMSCRWACFPMAEDPDVDPLFDLEVLHLLLLLLLEAEASPPPLPEPPWPLESLAPPELCPEAEPLVLLFPAVVPWLPPTVPRMASTWLRTVVLFALSIDPVSTT